MAFAALAMLVGGTAAFESIRLPIDGLATYVPQARCDARPKPGVVAFRKLVLDRYPGTRDLGIVRDCAPGLISEHYEGRAWDWGTRADIPREKAKAEEFLAWLLRPDNKGNQAAMARRLGVMYIIWNRRIWGSYRLAEGWRPYTGKEAHTDHIHFSFSWEGAFGCTTYWKAAHLPASNQCAHLLDLIASSGTVAPPPPPPPRPAPPPKAAPAKPGPPRPAPPKAPVKAAPAKTAPAKTAPAKAAPPPAGGPKR